MTGSWDKLTLFRCKSGESWSDIVGHVWRRATAFSWGLRAPFACVLFFGVSRTTLWGYEENGNCVTVYSMRGLVAEVDVMLKQNITPPAATAIGPAVGPSVKTGGKEDLITKKGIAEEQKRKRGGLESHPPMYYEAYGIFEGFSLNFQINILNLFLNALVLNELSPSIWGSGDRDGVTLCDGICDTPIIIIIIIISIYYIYIYIVMSHMYHVLYEDIR